MALSDLEARVNAMGYDIAILKQEVFDLKTSTFPSIQSQLKTVAETMAALKESLDQTPAQPDKQ
jgi:hypothetical protein